MPFSMEKSGESYLKYGESYLKTSQVLTIASGWVILTLF